MRPVTLSIWVPSAATSTGTGGASGMSRASLAVRVSPSTSHRLAPHQRQQDREVLPEVAHRLVPGDAQHPLDDQLVGQADAEREPALRHLLEGERLGGEHHRVTGEGGDDPGGQLDAGDLVRGDGEGGDGVDAEDLGHRHRGEPGLGRRPDLADDLVDGGGLDENAESHATLLGSVRRTTASAPRRRYVLRHRATAPLSRRVAPDPARASVRCGAACPPGAPPTAPLRGPRGSTNRPSAQRGGE